ncbi:MAG: carbon-nitrogen hydrolase family protein [Pseudomonadota bacterium]
MTTLAALQLGSDPHGTPATVDKIVSFGDEVRGVGADLVVLPEALLGGYPKGEDFGTRVGYRTDPGRDRFREYWQAAIDLDGPEVAALADFARTCGSALVVGVIERGGSTLYCTALMFQADGSLAAKHRKLVPTGCERLIWGQGDGSTMPVVDTKAGRISAAICWENYMPLFRTALYAKGVDVWCAPTVDERDIWQASMRHIAYEGRCFLVSACQYLPPPEPDAGFDWPAGKPLIRGGSTIVSPLGETLAPPLYGREGIVAAEIDLADLARARYDLDVVGHYARPDIFDLRVDETPRGVSFGVRPTDGRTDQPDD